MYQYASYHITALPLPYRGQRYHSFDRYHTGPYRYPSVDHYRRALTLSYNGHKAHSDYIEPRSGQLLPQCYVATLMLPSSMVLQPIPGLLMTVERLFDVSRHSLEHWDQQLHERFTLARKKSCLIGRPSTI